MRGEFPSQEQTTCSGNSRWSSVCRLARIEWNNRGQPETPARRNSRVISLRRLAFFHPIAVLAANCRGFLRNPRVRTSERSATFSEDLKSFIEDRSQLRKNRTTPNPAALVVLDLRFWDAHPIHFPIDVLPAQRQRFGGRSRPSFRDSQPPVSIPRLWPACDPCRCVCCRQGSAPVL